MRALRHVILSLAVVLAVGGWSAANGATQRSTERTHFLGAFFRPVGGPPFGVFAAPKQNVAPAPYPKPASELFGANGYCDASAANGVSIVQGNPIAPEKLSRIVDLGVSWTRTPASPFFDDRTHFRGAGGYAFADLDAAQCALVRKAIEPVIALEAGPVQYDTSPDRFSPHESPDYKTAADFATWCGVVATHERQIFTTVHRYTLPGNEVNSPNEMFPGGEAQIASYAKACYKAVKRADPHAFVYGFELNMDGSINAPGFVQRMYDRQCKVGTCYDGLSIHLSLRYPIPAATTPCFPHPGGDYSMQCVADIRTAAHAPLHILIGETVYVVPGSVPSEAVKAKAVVAEFDAFAADPLIDGANYANVDECALYSHGYFVGGCLVDAAGNKLPAYDALREANKRGFTGA
jgi:hypothetical protein